MSLSLADQQDGALVLRHLEGEADAFAVLYRRFFPRLVTWLTCKKSDLPAEDIAQEALLRALNHFEQFDMTRPMWPWLKVIAGNLAIDHERARGREVPFDLEERPGVTTIPEIPESSVIFQAIQHLPRRQRVAVSLRYLDEWAPSDIANFLGLKRPALEQLLFRARRRLQAECSRHKETILGAALIPLRPLRRLWTRLSDLPRQLNMSAAPTASGTTDVMAQLASAVLAVVTAASATALTDSGAGGGVAMGLTGTRSHKQTDSGDSLGKRGRAHRAVGGDSPGGPAGIGEDSLDRKHPRAAKRVVNDVKDPNRDVRRPEDSQITSMAFVPGGSGMVFAAGRTDCAVRCSNVLFKSTDRGTTWKRLPAEGFEGDQLILPPDPRDRRIFAMSPSGLQVSQDKGRTFHLAATVGSPNAAGSVAISPLFNDGDPSILIGAQFLFRYDDERRTIEPFPVTVTGPMHPVYSPNYVRDRRILVGAMSVDPLHNSTVPVIHDCRDSVCKEYRLPGRGGAPELRVSSDNSRRSHLFAFDSRHLFRSPDHGTTFVPTPTVPPGPGWLQDVAFLQGKTFVAMASETGGGLHVSADLGKTWTTASSSLFDDGVTAISVSGRRVLVALRTGGLACTNLGAHPTRWSRRCS